MQAISSDRVGGVGRPLETRGNFALESNHENSAFSEVYLLTFHWIVCSETQKYTLNSFISPYVGLSNCSSFII